MNSINSISSVGVNSFNLNPGTYRSGNDWLNSSLTNSNNTVYATYTSAANLN